jgi:hypothetical protein
MWKYIYKTNSDTLLPAQDGISYYIRQIYVTGRYQATDTCNSWNIAATLADIGANSGMTLPTAINKGVAGAVNHRWILGVTTRQNSEVTLSMFDPLQAGSICYIIIDYDEVPGIVQKEAR